MYKFIKYLYYKKVYYFIIFIIFFSNCTTHLNPLIFEKKQFNKLKTSVYTTLPIQLPQRLKKSDKFYYFEKYLNKKIDDSCKKIFNTMCLSMERIEKKGLNLNEIHTFTKSNFSLALNKKKLLDFRNKIKANKILVVRLSFDILPSLKKYYSGGRNSSYTRWRIYNSVKLNIIFQIIDLETSKLVYEMYYSDSNKKFLKIVNSSFITFEKKIKKYLGRS